LTCNAQTVHVVRFPLAKEYLLAPLIFIIGSVIVPRQQLAVGIYLENPSTSS